MPIWRDVLQPFDYIIHRSVKVTERLVLIPDDKELCKACDGYGTPHPGILLCVVCDGSGLLTKMDAYTSAKG